jgi:hypothetical protein
MPRVSLNRVEGLPDAMTTDSYEFIIGQLPGTIGTDKQLVVKCQQVMYPGVGQETVEMPLHGYILHFRGRKTFPRTLSVTYVETVDMGTTNTLESWAEFTVGTQTGTSLAYKNATSIAGTGGGGYAVNGAQLITYDVTGALAKTVTFYGLTPQDKPDVQYDSSSSTLYLVQQTYTYDYYIPSGVVISLT